MERQVSLIILSYNDRERLIASCKVCVEYLSTHHLDVEIIVVDDGSHPSRAAQPSELGGDIRLIRNAKNLGKGGAVRTGVQAARGRKIIFTDSDLPFTLEPLARTDQLLEGGYDVVIGNRLHPESRCEATVGFIRRLSSKLFTFLVNTFIGLPFQDTQCGYKGYRRDAAHDLYGSSVINSFAFDVEILLIARRRGYRIASLPLRLVNNDSTTVRLGPHGLQIIRDLIFIKIRDLLGRYR
jgi:dolichyl-phosphate beta-glucosyltransferase